VGRCGPASDEEPPIEVLAQIGGEGGHVAEVQIDVNLGLASATIPVLEQPGAN